MLSTFNISNDDNTGLSIGARTHTNPLGVTVGIRIGVSVTTNATAVPTQIGITSETQDPDVWHHVAVTYHSSTQWALYVDFVDAASNHFVDVWNPLYDPLRTEAYMATGFRLPPGFSGGTGRTRFGILDELVVFPEYLSADQIMQLQNSD